MDTGLSVAAPAKPRVQGCARNSGTCPRPSTATCHPHFLARPPLRHPSPLPSKEVAPRPSPPPSSLRMKYETWGGPLALPGWEVPPASPLCSLQAS